MVKRERGRGVILGVAVGIGVDVGVGVGAGVAVGVGAGGCAQYLPPVLVVGNPAQMITSLPVQTAVCSNRAEGALVMLVAVRPAREFPCKNFFGLYRDGRGAGVGRGRGVGVARAATQTLKKIGSWLAKGRPNGTPFPVKDPKKQLLSAFICM